MTLTLPRILLFLAFCFAGAAIGTYTGRRKVRRQYGAPNANDQRLLAERVRRSWRVA